MKKTILTIAGILALAILLTVAAFVGGRLLNGQDLTGGPSNGQTHAGGSEVHFIPAKELPQHPGDVNGLFDHRKDNSIFVGTGPVSIIVQKNEAGNTRLSSKHDGPTVEVVVTTQTIVYEDVTSKQFNGQPPAEGQQVQQVLEPGSLDKIGQNGMITVWGRKTGDRFIADVLLYEDPVFFNANP